MTDIEARYAVQPSALLDGWFAIHDQTTGVLARSRYRVIFRTQLEADNICDRLNREARRRAVCKVCRHRRLASTIEDGSCEECRKTTKAPGRK